MAWLLVIGLLHHFLVWWGDILSLYALVGMLAWFVYPQSPRWLVAAGLCLLLCNACSGSR